MTPEEKLHEAKQILIDRQRAYQLTFGGEGAAKAVLADLVKFCRAEQSTFHPDPRMAAMLDGRREVYLRIQKYLTWPTDRLFKTHGVDDG